MLGILQAACTIPSMPSLAPATSPSGVDLGAGLSRQERQDLDGLHPGDLLARSLGSGVAVRVLTERGARVLGRLPPRARVNIDRLTFAAGLGLDAVVDCLDVPGWVALEALAVDGSAVQARRSSLVAGPENVVFFFVDGDDRFFQVLSNLPALVRLRLCDNRLGPPGARRLARLQGLRWLDLRGNEIGDAGAEPLSQLTQLVRLDLAHNGITGPGARSLSKLQRLVQLDLSRNPVGHSGARSLATLEALVDLRVGECGLGPGSVKALMKLPALLHLDLSGNAIKSGGVRSLVRRAGWVRLWLQRCGLSDGDLQTLARLQGIERLALDGNGLSEPACAHLAQALPGSVIT